MNHKFAFTGIAVGIALITVGFLIGDVYAKGPKIYLTIDSNQRPQEDTIYTYQHGIQVDSRYYHFIDQGPSTTTAQIESNQAAPNTYGDLNQIIINESNTQSEANTINGQFIVIVEFTNRGIFTDANVSVNGFKEHIDLTQDSWVRYEFPKGNIPVGSSFKVSVTLLFPFLSYYRYSSTTYKANYRVNLQVVEGSGMATTPYLTAY